MMNKTINTKENTMFEMIEMKALFDAFSDKADKFIAEQKQ
jgi:hypothetical protein